MEELEKKDKETLTNIYDNIFLKISEKLIDVFLCGGAKTKDNSYIRDKLRSKIESNRNIRVLYPEDLFIDLLNKKKDYDLLTLEKLLADNSDVICIVCESPGSLVELGAFTNSDITFDKIIALISNKHSRNKSFIMLGPVRQLKKKDKNNVIFYGEDLDRLSKELISQLQKKRHSSFSKTSKGYIKGINTINGQYYYILMLIYYLNFINIKHMVKYLHFVEKEKKIDIKDFDVLYSASLKLLYKDRLIEKNMKGGEYFYELTPKGYNKVVNLLQGLTIKNISKSSDSVRLNIMNKAYY